HPVGAVHGRDAAQLPHGVLEALAEALEALGETERDTLPVGVSEDEVVEHVLKRGALDGNAQAVRVGEVRSAELSGLMELGEEDLPGRPRGGPPLLDAALQGP